MGKGLFSKPTPYKIVEPIISEDLIKQADDTIERIDWSTIYEKYLEMSNYAEVSLTPENLNSASIMIKKMLANINRLKAGVQMILSEFTMDTFHKKYEALSENYQTAGLSQALASSEHLVYMILFHKKIVEIFERDSTAAYMLLQLIALCHYYVGVQDEDFQNIDLALIKFATNAFLDSEESAEHIINLCAYLKAVQMYILANIRTLQTNFNDRELSTDSAARAQFRAMRKWQRIMHEIHREYNELVMYNAGTSSEELPEQEYDTRDMHELFCPFGPKGKKTLNFSQ